jgi:hypothetical protein
MMRLQYLLVQATTTKQYLLHHRSKSIIIIITINTQTNKQTNISIIQVTSIIIIITKNIQKHEVIVK